MQEVKEGAQGAKLQISGRHIYLEGRSVYFFLKSTPLLVPGKQPLKSNFAFHTQRAGATEAYKVFVLNNRSAS